MRARHRHFNPKAAGATAVFDSRYISGLSDGNSVETWTSRTGSNDITQANASLRPTYETNEINGNPSVLWDGGANDELTFSANLTYTNASIVIVYKNNDSSNGSVVFARNNSNFQYYYFATNFARFSSNDSADNANTRSDRTHNLGNVFLIASGTARASTSITAFVNGLAGATTTASVGASYTTSGIGKYGGGGAFNTEGHLGLALLADVAWSDPLRKRLEHAAAYSFKISCN